jgi:hypothetical protein
MKYSGVDPWSTWRGAHFFCEGPCCAILRGRDSRRVVHDGVLVWLLRSQNRLMSQPSGASERLYTGMIDCLVRHGYCNACLHHQHTSLCCYDLVYLLDSW